MAADDHPPDDGPPPRREGRKRDQRRKRWLRILASLLCTLFWAVFEVVNEHPELVAPLVNHL